MDGVCWCGRGLCKANYLTTLTGPPTKKTWGKVYALGLKHPCQLSPSYKKNPHFK